MTVEEIIERAEALIQSEGEAAGKAFFLHEMEKLRAEGVPVDDLLQDHLHEQRVDIAVRQLRIAIYEKAWERLPAEKFFTAEDIAAIGREVLRDAGIVDDDDAADGEPAPS